MPILIFITNFIKGKFGIKTKGAKDTAIKKEPVKLLSNNTIGIAERFTTK